MGRLTTVATTPGGASTSSGLAIARAKHALAEAGLESNVELTRASSVTNEVWLTPDFAVRVNRRPDHRLRREAQLGPKLPDEVRYPEIVAYGTGTGFDWLVVRRRPGIVLSRCWPTMSPAQRRFAVRQLAFMLRALHQSTSPVGLDDVGAPQLLQGGQGQAPAAPLLAGIERMRTIGGVDTKLVESLRDIVRSTARVLEPFDVPTLVHGDLTFENVLWDGDQVTALIDFEWARAAPSDVDLDVFLRFCAFPHLHVADDYVSQTKAEDYEDVPWWLREDYPQLFSFPHALDRLRLYAIAFEVRQLLAMPSDAASGLLTTVSEHPLSRLSRLASHRSYLDLHATPGSR
jgi:aminoglycoside phosphotransferase (APT) family kinase protein